MESAFNDTLIANVTTGTASAVSRYVYYKDSAGVRIDSTGEMAGYQTQNLSFTQHYDEDGVSYLGSAKAVLWPDKNDYINTTPFVEQTPYVWAYGNGTFVAGTFGGSVAASTDGAAWAEVKPLTGDTDSNWMYVFAFGNDTFVAAGGSGKVATSSDGHRWTARTPATVPSSWTGAGYGGGLFVLVSNAGAINTSPDGITWTARTSVVTTYANHVAYLNGLHLLLCGSGQLATSPDGVTWTARTSGFGTDDVLRGAYGNGVFVIVGAGGKLSSSMDGAAWTSRTANLGTSSINDVVFANGLFVAAGAGGIATSPDGITWTLRSALANNGIASSTSIQYSHGQFIVAGPAGKVVTSPDGITWTERTVWSAAQTPRAVIHGDGILVAFGASGSISTSENGTSWTDRTFYNISQDPSVAGYGLNHYFLSDGNIARFSTDGMSWFAAGNPLGGVDLIRCFAASPSIVVVAGDNGKLYTATSISSGMTWTQRTSTFGTSPIRGLVWSGSLFVAVGDGGKLATSPDGITWTSRTSSFSTTNINSVTYGSATFVAVGAAGKAATSPDGITWTQRTSSFGSTDIFSVVYGDKFVATGSGTTAASSPDGITWTQRTITISPTNVAYGNSQYIMGGNGTFATSSDGITWTNGTHYTMPGWINFIAFGGGMFLFAVQDWKFVVSADGNFVAGHTINGTVLAALDGGSGVVAPSLPSAGIAYSAGTNAPRTAPNGVQIRFNSTGDIVGPVLSDRIIRSLAAGTVSNDLTTVGALSCGLLTSYTSPSVYTEVSTATHPDYARKANNLAAGGGHKLTLAQAMNFSFPLNATTANITHLAVFLTSSSALAWVVPLPTPIPSGTAVASYSVVAGAFTLDFADAATVGP